MVQNSYTSFVAEKLRQLAGGVFAYAYNGPQLSPGNPDYISQTEAARLRKLWFGWIIDEWNSLTALQQGTFNTAGGSAPEGFKLFIIANINAYLIGEPTITNYTPAADPPVFPVAIITNAANTLIIQASSILTIVPASNTLLILATPEKKLPGLTSYPEDYAPITTFPEGTDLSIAANITTAWTNFFGVLRGSRRICINPVLIRKDNGNRSQDSIICSPVQPNETFRIMDDDGTFIIDQGGQFVVSE